MNSAYDALPPELARHVSPRWRKNELEYWEKRDELLDQYRNKWVGFADGKVIACGTSPVAVFHEAENTGLHPFVTCVGREDEPDRIRSFSPKGRDNLAQGNALGCGEEATAA